MDVDKKMTTFTNIAVNVKYSKMELVQQAGLNTLLGMGVTFSVLIILIGVISMFNLIPYFQERRRNKAAAAAAVSRSIVKPGSWVWVQLEKRQSLENWKISRMTWRLSPSSQRRSQHMRDRQRPTVSLSAPSEKQEEKEYDPVLLNAAQIRQSRRQTAAYKLYSGGI